MADESENAVHEAHSGLNENHQRRLTTSFEHIDRVLSEAEAIMAGGDSPSPFRSVVADLTPVQRRVVQDYIARFRRTMGRILSELGYPLPPPVSGARWVLRGQLLGIAITLDELDGRYMRGYGTLPDDAVLMLARIRSELQAQVARIDSYLAQSEGACAQDRLRQREQTTDEARLLVELDRVVTRCGLVEFRGAVAMLAERVADPALEIAVFGRVSSGKSSLLNHLLGGDILPVGVTPVTALPVHLSAAEQPAVTVEFAESASQTVEVGRLQEFCSERHNPGNAKRVRRLRVGLPAPLLRRGVTFADTPGLGSLALAGAEETIAYLPRCDVGVVLVDAASTVTHEDLALVEALYRAGATAMVLISKADLLTEAERAQAVDYTGRQLRDQVGVEAAVYAVSVRGVGAGLCDRWLAHGLEPILAQHGEESRRSLRRKVGGLRDAVVEALRTRLRVAEGPPAQAVQARMGTIRRALGDAERILDEAHRQSQDAAADWAAVAAGIVEAAVAAAAAPPGHDGAGPPLDAARITAMATEHVHRALAPLRQTLMELRTRVGDLLDVAEGATGRPTGDLVELPAPGGMPVPELTDVLGASRPPVVPVALRWNPRLRRGWVRRHLRQRLGAGLLPALDRYGRQVRSWARGYVDELRTAFWSRGEVCRAWSALTPAPGEVSRGEIEECLRALEPSGP